MVVSPYVVVKPRVLVIMYVAVKVNVHAKQTVVVITIAFVNLFKQPRRDCYVVERILSNRFE